MESHAWEAIERLMTLLGGEALRTSLFLWKKKGRASASETYGWRRAIDMIKESDLRGIGRNSKSEGETLSLMKSKPIMLRIAGEIANALLHSYDLGHQIEFFQISSTRPS